jgi:FkbM family methyltransferase
MGVVSRAHRIIRGSSLLKPLFRPPFVLLQWLNHGRSKVLKTVQGIRYELDLNQLIDSSIYYADAFEPDSTAAINRFIKPGDTVLDVGANVGYHALLFSKLAGPQGCVIAFEPTGWAIRKLKRNRDLNLDSCAQNLVLERLGVGDRPATSQHVRFRSSWLLFGSAKPPEEEIVDFVTIDGYVEKKSLQTVNFIKIDVDGYEYKVIKGALHTLQKHKPTLMLELGSYTLSGAGDRLEDLVDCLYGLGYAIRWDKELHAFLDRNEILATVPPDSTINVFCLPDKAK